MRKHNKYIPISLYLNDLPQVDFSHAIINVTSGLKDNYDNLFIYSIGASYYERLFPDQSVDFFFTKLALYYPSGPIVAKLNKIYFAYYFITLIICTHYL